MPPAPSNDNSADAVITKPLWLPPPPQLRPRHSPDASHQSHRTPMPPMLTIPRPMGSTPSPQPRPRRLPGAPHQRHLTPTPLMLAIARLLWRPSSPQPHQRHQTGPCSSRSSTVACNRLLGRLLLTPQLLKLRVGRFGSPLQPRVTFSPPHSFERKRLSRRDVLCLHSCWLLHER